MAKKQKVSTGSLTSKARAKTRGADDPGESLKTIHNEIRTVRNRLLQNIPDDELGKERVIAAIRNLDVARVVLECNQSLSPLDYNIEPWKHLPAMDRLLAGKKGAKKSGNARRR
jgi:hypothetical protein